MRKTIFLFIITFLFLNSSYSQNWSSDTSTINIWNTNSGNVGIGTNAPQSKLDVNGEIRSTLTGISNIRLVGNGYTSMLRNDGINTYLLLTNNNDINGSFNALRPFWVNNATGNISFADSKVLIVHDTGNLTLTGNLGIGTTAPIAGLEIYKGNTNNLALLLNSSGAGWGSGIRFRNTYNNSNVEYGIYNGSDKKLHFTHPFNGDAIIIDGDKVGIGEYSPDYKLDVNGTIHAKEIIVDMNGWSDFVFNKDYKLSPLNEVYNYIQNNGHLPNIPSEKDVKDNGVNVVDMQAKLLQKIEELTLYVIEQDNKIKNLESQLKQQIK